MCRSNGVLWRNLFTHYIFKVVFNIPFLVLTRDKFRIDLKKSNCFIFLQLNVAKNEKKDLHYNESIESIILKSIFKKTIYIFN